MTEGPCILALDASTEACSAALLIGEERRERFSVLPRGHARHLIGMADALLQEAGIAISRLDLLVYGRGPGAFTGVRIGVGVAQGLAFGAGCQVYGVSTLEALAEGCRRRRDANRVLVAMDARMGEVYWAACARDTASALMRVQGEERVSVPDQVRLPPGWGDWMAAGTGWRAYGQPLRGACGVPAATDDEALPRALDMLPYGLDALRRGAGALPETACPVYLRDKVTGN
ncbi:MAG: tRNA (adenosine(37)-N6)-threonylcarbamoyltransferase complex dimerization subunit type 1 TsaB [Ectothiorhodospiraceae bacterium]|nr:tRNA (adenosine(37)-N6)-threonylcarbamoyltransferase complex dimerization subunit type 1 TsaB [Ectothiorhodospiraceae bacterium]